MNANNATRHAQRMISDETIERFERDGAVIIRKVIAADWIDRLRTAIDAVLASPGYLLRQMAT